MTATPPGLPLANFLDVQGHWVTATVTSSGLLAILSHSPAGQLCSGGHPCLSAENARELGEALIAFADGDDSG